MKRFRSTIQLLANIVLSTASMWGQQPLTLSLDESDRVEVSWQGSGILQVSTNLLDWNDVEAVDRPAARALTGQQEYYRLRMPDRADSLGHVTALLKQ